MSFCLFILLCAPFSSRAYAQAASETAGTNSVAAAAGAPQPKPAPLATIPAADHPGRSPHLAAHSGLTSAVLNRRNLEQRAGGDAGKLLLRSVPSGAQAWIDGVPIGNTPMLLMLAPGKYRVEIHGPRQKFASSSVELQPRETRDMAMTLKVRYPTNVVVR